MGGGRHISGVTSKKRKHNFPAGARARRRPKNGSSFSPWRSEWLWPRSLKCDISRHSQLRGLLFPRTTTNKGREGRGGPGRAGPGSDQFCRSSSHFSLKKTGCGRPARISRGCRFWHLWEWRTRSVSSTRAGCGRTSRRRCLSCRPPAGGGRGNHRSESGRRRWGRILAWVKRTSSPLLSGSPCWETRTAPGRRPPPGRAPRPPPAG